MFVVRLHSNTRQLQQPPTVILLFHNENMMATTAVFMAYSTHCRILQKHGANLSSLAEGFAGTKLGGCAQGAYYFHGEQGEPQREWWRLRKDADCPSLQINGNGDLSRDSGLHTAGCQRNRSSSGVSPYKPSLQTAILGGVLRPAGWGNQEIYECPKCRAPWYSSTTGDRKR